jgi:hypothetical protein
MIAMVNKDNWEGNFNAATVPYKSYKLNAQTNCNINIDGKPKVKGYWSDASGLAFSQFSVSGLLDWCWLLNF